MMILKEEKVMRSIINQKKIIERTPNIKQMYFDYLDGKRDRPDFKYFSPEGL